MESGTPGAAARRSAAGRRADGPLRCGFPSLPRLSFPKSAWPTSCPSNRSYGGQGPDERSGQSTADQLMARVYGLRLADRVLPCGDLIEPAMRELRAAVRLYRETSHAETVSRALLVGIGELAQVSGRIASDAGQHAKAEQVYRLGLSAAQAAEDRTLANSPTPEGNAKGSTSQGGPGRSGPDAYPTTRALCLDRVAWAHTRAAEPQAALRALAEAHDVSAEELDVMDARVLTELRKPLRAVPLLTEVLDRYDASHTRELALYLSWLAVAYADANEPDEAAATAQRVIDPLGRLGQRPDGRSLPHRAGQAGSLSRGARGGRGARPVRCIAGSAARGGLTMGEVSRRRGALGQGPFPTDDRLAVVVLEADFADPRGG